MNLKNRLAKFLKAKAEEAKKDPNPIGCHRLALDGRYGVYVGWLDGYDKHSAYVIHAADEPQYGLVVGIRKLDYDYWAEFDALGADGDEAEYDTSFNPNMSDKDYIDLADTLLNAWREIKK